MNYVYYIGILDLVIIVIWLVELVLHYSVHLGLMILSRFSVTNRKHLGLINLDDNKLFWENIEDTIHTAKEIHFAGGEPSNYARTLEIN